MSEALFDGRLAVIQRVLPSYRAPFFEMLAGACSGGLTLLAGQPRPDEAIDAVDAIRGVNLIRLQNRHLFKGPAYLCIQRGLEAALRQANPDALIVEANPRYLSTPPALRWMKRQNRPVIGWGLGAGGGALAFLRRSFLMQFDALLTYSQTGAAGYAAAGFNPARIFVAPNAAAGRPRQALPQRAPGFSGRPVVLFVGRLQTRKRLDLLLQACAALPEALQPRLVIVGDGPARPEVESAVQSFYPSAELAGAQHGPALEPYFRQADLFVLPGTGGLAVQQAMSWGLPVIAAEADGTQADLVRAENGWQVQPGSLDSLTAALSDALGDAARLRQMGAASYRIVAEEINLESMTAAFIKALQAVRSHS